jgi:Flp pilus assembly protein TadD
MTIEQSPHSSQKGDASMTGKIRKYCLWAVLLLLAGCAQGAKSPGGVPGVNTADAALDGGMPDTALNVTRTILQSNPRDVGALERQGMALDQLNQPDAAMEAWRRALAINPASQVAALGLGRLQLSRGNAADAELSFSKLLARTPDDRIVLNDLGVALDLQGKHSAAQVIYAKLLNLNTNDRAAAVNMALSLSLSGQASRSVAMLRGPGSRPDAIPRVRQDLAVALALSGDTGEAEKLLLTDLSLSDAAAALAGYRALGVTVK